eukprot:m.79940 g.79940  ORF g.79940 m.79940 type:complete len:87 (-) comp8018_c0_seq3:42-302(-)
MACWPIELFSSISVDKSGLTAMHHAAVHGNDGVFQALALMRANPNVRSPDGNTPLHIVSQRSRRHLAEILLQHCLTAPRTALAPHG